MSSTSHGATGIYARIAHYLLLNLGWHQSERGRHSAFELARLPLDLAQSKLLPKRLLISLLTRFLPIVRTNLTGMSTENERAYCRWYASRLYSGRGAIVELGCWLGSLTISLADGLEKNVRIGPERKKINAHDHFKWDSVMEGWVAGTRLAGRVERGDDYLELFLECIAPVAGYVKVSKADLTTARWDGGDIELLVVDAMKSMRLASNILRSFFGSLIPGIGYVVHQDYLHFFHSWIHVSMFQLRHYFDFIYEVPASDMVIFKCKKKIPASALKFPTIARDLSRGLIDDAYDWNFTLIGKESWDRLAAAKTMMFVHRGEREEARCLYLNYTSGEYCNSLEFQRMKDFTSRFDKLRFL